MHLMFNLYIDYLVLDAILSLKLIQPNQSLLDMLEWRLGTESMISKGNSSTYLNADVHVVKENQEIYTISCAFWNALPLMILI